jgi:UDP-3-O-[3-hydroxymyristoyl] glucosamine N-acyltransferase
MNLETLLELDPSWRFQEGKIWDGDNSKIQGVCLYDRPLPHHLVLIKNKSFLNRLLDFVQKNKIPLPSPLGLVTEEGFWQEQQNAFRQILDQSWVFVATVKDITAFLTRTSYIFYEQKNSEAYDGIDGREDGTAKIHPSARIFPYVFIGRGVVIEEGAQIHSHCAVHADSKVGRDTVLFSHVTIYPRVEIGSRCRLHAGVVIGSDGFGYHFIQGVHQKIWHYGGVIVGDEVEIGSNTTIDSGTFSPTTIGPGAKIDNQVQLGHNCRIGRGVIICGQVGLSGSVQIDDFSVLAGKAGVGPDVHIGKGCQIAGNAMVAGDLEDGAQVAGHPARPVREWLQGVAYLRKLSLQDKKTEKKTNEKNKPEK